MKLTGKDASAALVLALGLGAVPALRADVTIRYQAEFKPAPALQPILQPFMKTMAGGAGTAVRIKGAKAYTTSGKLTQIFDLTKQEVTLIDPEHKTVATLPASQLADKMSAAIPHGTAAQTEAAEKALASIKSHVDSRVTGKTDEIFGVQAEEREITLTMDMPMPAAVKQDGLTMKMVFHVWTAKKEEALRVPAIRELTGYQAMQKYIMNPAGMMGMLAGRMPGLSSGIAPMLEELFKNPSVVLRTQAEIYVPFLAVMAKQMANKDQGSLALDPDAPVMEMTQEIAELSTAPVDASLFEIPSDYTTVPAEDMIQEMIKAQLAAVAPPATGEPK